MKVTDSGAHSLEVERLQKIIVEQDAEIRNMRYWFWRLLATLEKRQNQIKELEAARGNN